jgi:hypothetical protein
MSATKSCSTDVKSRTNRTYRTIAVDTTVSRTVARHRRSGTPIDCRHRPDE